MVTQPTNDWGLSCRHRRWNFLGRLKEAFQTFWLAWSHHGDQHQWNWPWPAHFKANCLAVWRRHSLYFWKGQRHKLRVRDSFRQDRRHHRCRAKKFESQPIQKILSTHKGRSEKTKLIDWKRELAQLPGKNAHLRLKPITCSLEHHGLNRWLASNCRRKLIKKDTDCGRWTI